ncbi:PDZ domain-containing protein [Roseburia sp. MUC/MUC-530-WT-4D]|uniref:PDZ domain-containing protein n=1 Tax=Roseburia porci TaxID=2605790 RepID=A0A6L5YNX2_9FIRM|nr:trypsin-like peptidase domain-containing protein [Roseburia porci]MST74115.1 PDZ domain-containing protein [Roseburia porci]
MEDQKQQKNEFIREQIKNKPVNRKKAAAKVGICAICGVVFALAAAVTFVLAEPAIRKILCPQEEENPDSVNTYIADTESVTESEQSDPDVTSQAQESLSIADYQILQNQLYAIGSQGNYSIVTVTSVVSNTDWFHNSYESEGQGSGVIIQENASEVLILTEQKVITDPSRITVTFIDDTTAGAVMKKYDGNTGIAVLSVAKSDISDSTLDTISIAEFGNSNGVTKGSIVIALGSPLGTNYSILTGNVTSTDNEISTIDHNYSIFTTDIVASKSSSGILINVSGQIVGMVMQDYSNSSEENTLIAVSSTELKSMIDMLAEGKDIPYLGMTVTTVTEKIEKEYDIPEGVYIKEAMMDSPAMAAGLQSGDVITKINGEKVASDTAYSSQVMKLTPGDTIPVVVQRQSADGYSEITCKVEVGVLE